MKKEANYFPHYYGARNDDKILKIRSRFDNCWGYGLFFMLCETMAESSKGTFDYESMAELSLSYSIDTDKIKQLVDYCIEIELFYKSDNNVHSKTMDDFKQFRKERSDSGKKGAMSKWHSDGLVNGSAINQPMALKESKVNKSKVNKSKIKENDIDKQKLLTNQITSFNIMWNKYPKRLGKKQAFKHYSASVKSKEDFENINTALNNYLKQIEKDSIQDKFIRHGSTWFNNWQDYLNVTEAERWNKL